MSEIQQKTHDDRYARTYVNLAEKRLGSEVLTCSDDFFASKDNLLETGRGVFIADRFTENGKWMDGWESRRRRQPGHDWCIIKLGARGVVKFLDIDTNWFTGNYPEKASVEAFDGASAPTDADQWQQLLPQVNLQGDKQNFFTIQAAKPCNYLRFNIFPDGGVARLRVYGDPLCDWRQLEGQQVDLGATAYGGKALAASDQHFGAMDNLLAPGRGINMGDGWETRRRRGPGYDWVIIRLAHRGRLQRVLIDTAHFKGNYPDSFSLQGGLFADQAIDWEQQHETLQWQELSRQTKLSADSEHGFELSKAIEVDHVKLSIYPDGGVSRLRLLGVIS